MSDDANCEWAQYRKDYGVDPTDATHKAFHAGFKAAQKCAEDGGWSWPVDTAPEPVYVTGEPSVGSQVTDCTGDVWERREGGWALWWPEKSGWIADLYGGELDPWPVVRDQAPLRSTTDEDRKRVGLPVDTAPDVDPDEERSYRDGYHDGVSVAESVARLTLSTARAQRDRAEKAEAEVERLTRERDFQTGRAERAEAAMRDEVAEHDKTRAAVLRLTRQRDKAVKRHTALRADVELERDGRIKVRDRNRREGNRDHAGAAEVSRVNLMHILARDNERMGQA